MNPKNLNPKLLFVSVLLFAAFNYPLLHLAYKFDLSNPLKGLSLYIGFIWLLYIVCAYVYMRSQPAATNETLQKDE